MLIFLCLFACDWHVSIQLLYWKIIGYYLIIFFATKVYMHEKTIILSNKLLYKNLFKAKKTRLKWTNEVTCGSNCIVISILLFILTWYFNVGII